MRALDSPERAAAVWLGGRGCVDGDRFLYGMGTSIWEHDLTSTRLVYDSEGELSLTGPVYADGQRAFAVASFASTDRDIVRIDLDTGTATLLGVPDIGYNAHISWGRVPYDIDVDRDGLANGIDPVP